MPGSTPSRKGQAAAVSGAAERGSRWEDAGDGGYHVVSASSRWSGRCDTPVGKSAAGRAV